MKLTYLFSRIAPFNLIFISVFLIVGCAAPTSHKLGGLTIDQLPNLPSAAEKGALQLGSPPVLWWKQIGDAHLSNLVHLAWENNYDLRVAASRLIAVREQLHATESTRLPSVNFDASAGRTRLSAVESKDGEANITSSVQWHLALSWELDLFGRIRHGLEAAQASVAENAALRDDARRLILANVVEAYFDLRSAQLLKECLKDELNNQAATLKLLLERENAGSAPRADRVRFEAQFRLSSARLPTVLAQERAARNRLATLTGQRLDATELEILDKSTPIMIPHILVVDEPASLLRRRPDIRAAEQILAGAVAREGLAFAELFPRISLSGLLGGIGTSSNWTSSEAGRWYAGTAFSLPIFDAGARRAKVRAATAEIDAARANFEKVVATALEETDTAISAWSQLRDRYAQLERAHVLAQESANLVRARFREGAEGLLAVLDAERTALATREQLVITSRDLAIATARSYVAMAGGLDTDEHHN